MIVAMVLNLPFLNNQIFLNEKIFIITNSCLGFVTMSVLFSLIFSLRKLELIKKAGLFIVGAGVIFLINILRLIVVVFSEIVGVYSNLVHTLTWFFMSFVVLVFFILSTNLVSGKKLNELV
jgi:exosortase/archaeosortase family protein